ncbi:hypothetical protein MA16_Dca028605 [Dendrobium catenatum]|uniref:Uncharacterized protein n=1 Tax=Dendrobium catenatum TaxID=906689 RepID=A0A2I0VFQ0_9ASPA|nr:hypothetical protein MA16_Dca028605 [Dendrobium catenatum]
MAGRKIEVLEGEIGQLKTDLEERTVEFQNQFASIHEKMDGRFTSLEEMMKKMLEGKPNPTTTKAREATGDNGRNGNPNPLRGRETTEVEILDGNDGMPPLEPLSRRR